MSVFRRAVLLVLLLALAGVTTPASPVQVSYVYSDSMEPTIGTNDGFFLVPAGHVETGDIVAFYSPQRGELVTHRVVGRTDGGYVTRGDNNPTTDQVAGYSPVTDEEITGEVLTVAGDPVVVPGLGLVISFVVANRPLLLGAAVLLLLTGLVGDGEDAPAAERTQYRASDLVHPLMLSVLVASALLVSLGASQQSLTYVAAEAGEPGGHTMTVGEPSNETVVVQTRAIPFTRRVLDVDGMTVTNTTRNESAVVLETRVPPPSTTGPHRTNVGVYRYPAVVPRGLQRSMHAVHPSVAGVVSGAVLLLPFALLYLLLIDGAAPLRTRGTRRTRRGRS